MATNRDRSQFSACVNRKVFLISEIWFVFCYFVSYLCFERSGSLFELVFHDFQEGLKFLKKLL